MFRYLELWEIEELHLDSLKAYGGTAGTRDPGAVEAARAAAVNTALYGHGDLFEVAAAYAFHVAEAQAFIDGNKRTAIATALAFLSLNQPMRRPSASDLDSLYQAMIMIARHEMDRAGVAELFRKLFA